MTDKIRVVIAEDEVASLNGLVLMVDSLGGDYEVVGTAADGAAALELCRTQNADILLTDIRMPVMTGIELTRKLAQDGSRVTVIIVSAYDDREYLQHAIRSPVVFDYVLKPFHKSEFAELLKSAAAFAEGKRRAAKSAGAEDISAAADEIASLMRSGKGGEAVEVFMRVWRPLTEGGDAKCLKTASEILMKIVWSMRPAGDAKNTVFHIYSPLKALEECGAPEELRDYLTDYIKRNSADPSGQNRITALVSACLKLTDENYSDASFGIAQAAEVLDVTPNYLSSRFHRDVGISFSRYLAALRLQKAKEYLCSTNLKIYQISSMVGFEDSGYFDRVFKNAVGVKPSEYRDAQTLKK